MILGICDNVSVLEVLKIVKLFIQIIKIAVPIILLVVLMIDFMSSIKVGDEDLLKKAEQKAVKRAIAAVLIFLVPTLVNVVIKVSMPNTQVGQCLNNATTEGIRQKRIEYVETLIQRAENSKSYSDYSNALLEIRNIDDPELKQSYSDRLAVVKETIDEKIEESESSNKPKSSDNVTLAKGDRICNTPYANMNGHTTHDYYQVFEYNSPYPDNYVRESFDQTGSVWGAYSFTASTKNSYVSFLENNYPGMFTEFVNAAKSTNYGDNSPMISYIKAAYNAHPTEFIESQDRFMFESYGYATTLQQIEDLGIDLDKRPSIITGMFLSMADAGGALSVADKMVGKINDNMSDYELVDAACDAFVNSAFGQKYWWVADRWSNASTASTAIMIPERQFIKDVLSGKYNCE